jgi:NCS2 family nucleobase:cation symporter-2
MDQHPLRELNGKVSPVKVFPYSLQQILAMFVNNLVPIGIITAAVSPELPQEMILVLIQNAMLAAGIATFVQATPFWRLGSGLPIFMGISFTFVVPLSVVASSHGYGAVVGCVLAGGVFEGLLGLTAKYWKNLISPIVSAVVVTGIGVSLLSTAARSFGGGYTDDFGSVPNLVSGIVTLASCLLWQIFMKGTKKQLSLLAGLTAGYLTALLFGLVDLSHLTECGWFALPRILPVPPVFRLDAIISICIIYLVSATETIGDISALTGGALHRQAKPNEISGGLAVDGFGSAVGGLFGAAPVTSYSQNIGLTIMTGIVNRNVARVGALIMVLCSLFPPVGQFLRSVPVSVIGGVLLIVIGQILVSGFQMIAETGFTARNKIIASLSLAMGIGFTASTEAGIWDQFPVAVRSVFSQNVVAVIFVVALILNLVLPKHISE